MQPTYCSKLIAAATIAVINVFIPSHLLPLSECTDNCLLLPMPPRRYTLNNPPIDGPNVAKERKSRNTWIFGVSELLNECDHDGDGTVSRLSLKCVNKSHSENLLLVERRRWTVFVHAKMLIESLGSF